MVAKYNDADIDRLLKNERIVRHRGKIEAVINNAKKAIELVEREGSLAAYFWRFEPHEKSLPEPQTASTSEESIALSKALKKQGWKFVGPTTVYAFMQAMGLINDHAEEKKDRTCTQSFQVSWARITPYKPYKRAQNTLVRLLSKY